jgi:hypothetical protein
LVRSQCGTPRPPGPAHRAGRNGRQRIVRVVAEARGQRTMIESIDETGRTLRSTVKWINLSGLGQQLF